jgi:hypothetical protein
MGLRITAAVAAGLIAIAVIGVYLASRHGPVGSVPAGGQEPPQAIHPGDLKAGTYAITYHEFDLPGKPYPKVVITVPDGWSFNNGFAVSNTSRQIFVTIWDGVDVYANGCHWLGPMIHPGPTVDELAAVLAARPLRNATAPVAVSLGEYYGKYLEWSVPVDIHFSDCDGAMFKSWNDIGGDRYQQGPGQVDRLWIIDVGGRRLLVDASYMPEATQQDRAELTKVVDSIVFKP